MEDNTIDYSNADVESITFLTPVRIVLKTNSGKRILMANADIFNQKIYVEGTIDEALSRFTFDYLNRVHTLPEDLFVAPDSVVEHAIQAENDRLEMYKNTVIGEI